MRCKEIFLFAIIWGLAVAGCKKAELKPVPLSKSSSPSFTATDVYVAGYITAANGNNVAAYWKNGVITKLADSTVTSQASAIIVIGSDVYVAGVSSVPDQVNSTVTYWKNGVATRMSINANLGLSQSAFAINGNDLYMAGDFVIENLNLTKANYWKNNVSTSLPDSGGSFANGICVDGSDIYVAGYANGNLNVSVASYWKNGALTKLDEGKNDQSLAYAVRVSGSDVYVAGYTQQFFSATGDTSRATYWKNGVANVLPDLSTASFAYDIAVSNNDVYVAGYGSDGTLPGYWKNDIFTPMDLTNAGSSGGFRTASLAIDHNDVYMVAGYPAYWKNGTAVQLAPNGGAMGIYVVSN